MTLEDREKIDITTAKLVCEEKIVRTRFQHFRNFSILSVLFILSFIVNYNESKYFVVFLILFTILSLLMMLATYVSYDNWKFTKGLLKMYTMPDDEFRRGFEDFCDRK